MFLLRKSREQIQVSQRNLAKKSGSSFRTIQLLESGRHDPRISTLEKLAQGLGYPKQWVANRLESLWSSPPYSASVVAEFISEQGESTWKLHLMNFVDRFRDAENKQDCISEMPQGKISPRQMALLTSTVETLCEESNIPIPLWAGCIPTLSEPWFVAELENLKALSIIESPIHFRKRGIFVLGNFLKRA